MAKAVTHLRDEQQHAGAMYSYLGHRQLRCVLSDCHLTHQWAWATAAAAAMLGDDIFDAVDEQTIAKTKSRACAVQ